ncbi:MAG: FxsA family protein [Pseudomonadales bacterium]
MLKILVIGLPLLELLGLLLIAEGIGPMWMLVEIVATFGLGLGLIKRSGQSIQSSFGALQRMGTHSISEIFNPLKGILSGLLLCLPGLLSDVVAMIIVLGFFKRTGHSGTNMGQKHGSATEPFERETASGRIIEGEYSTEVLTKKDEP